MRPHFGRLARATQVFHVPRVYADLDSIRDNVPDPSSIHPVCNGPKKCIFVRVIDTCAGCARGSKHVDLTKSAFRSLADLDRGRLDNVRMRPATHPDEWWVYNISSRIWLGQLLTKSLRYEELWGPKHY